MEVVRNKNRTSELYQLLTFVCEIALILASAYCVHILIQSLKQLSDLLLNHSTAGLNKKIACLHFLLVIVIILGITANFVIELGLWINNLNCEAVQ